MEPLALHGPGDRHRSRSLPDDVAAHLPAAAAQSASLLAAPLVAAHLPVYRVMPTPCPAWIPGHRSEPAWPASDARPMPLRTYLRSVHSQNVNAWMVRRAVQAVEDVPRQHRHDASMSSVRLHPSAAAQEAEDADAHRSARVGPRRAVRAMCAVAYIVDTVRHLRPGMQVPARPRIMPSVSHMGSASARCDAQSSVVFTALSADSERSQARSTSS